MLVPIPNPQPDTASPTMEFQSGDPSFRVSWLLGLRPYRTYRSVARCPQWAKVKVASCPEWAKEFQTDDPSFLVSHVLGIIPSPDTSAQAAQKTLEYQKKWDIFGLRRLYGELPDEEAALKEAIANEIKWDIFGLRRLYGELSAEESESGESEESEQPAEEEAASETDPVLATPEFLDLCLQLEALIDEIEVK